MRTKIAANTACAIAVALYATTATFGQSADGQQASMTFFITSVGLGKGADLGGIEGADAHCQALAQAAGAGAKTWRAYLSNSATAAKPEATVNARDRIGRGPWQNAKGAVIATSVDDLHSDNNKISKETALNEKGDRINVRGDKPNMHDILTGTDMDGRAFPENLRLTCTNWTSSTSGVAMLGHVDREGNPPQTRFSRSWNAAHTSRGCSQPDLIASGGNGLFYCFAQ
jgi:hypothetical protein